MTPPSSGYRSTRTTLSTGAQTTRGGDDAHQRPHGSPLDMTATILTTRRSRWRRRALANDQPFPAEPSGRPRWIQLPSCHGPSRRASLGGVSRGHRTLACYHPSMGAQRSSVWSRGSTTVHRRDEGWSPRGRQRGPGPLCAARWAIAQGSTPRRLRHPASRTDVPTPPGPRPYFSMSSFVPLVPSPCVFVILAGGARHTTSRTRQASTVSHHTCCLRYSATVCWCGLDASP